jgi:hypothetical protein
MIKAADDDIVRRRLAFRIIVNAVSFEDLMGVRVHLRMRELRDVLLSQISQRVENYNAADEICDSTVRSLWAPRPVPVRPPSKRSSLNPGL